MDKPKATPKDFFMWVGVMLSLWGSIIAFISLIFSYLDYVFPYALDSYSYMDPFSGGIAYEMASLIVLAPTFLILMRAIRRNIAHDSSRGEVWVRRWALYLTLFIAGATIVVDLIVLLTTFLQGEELTIRFLLKVLVVLLVAAAGFMHFSADLWGFWSKHPVRARYINWATGALVLVTILAGFLIVGTPGDARKARVDQERVYGLQSIQGEVVSYWQSKEQLPTTLSDLDDSLSYYSLPTDPETGAQYRYRATAPLSFELCATFGAASRGSQSSGSYTSSVKPVRYDAQNDNWQHAAGEACFTRTIDPERYPPYTQTPYDF